MKQTILKVWKDDYSFEFIHFKQDNIFNAILSSSYPILLNGVSKSGKKHLAWQISNLRHSKIYLLNELSDSQIIHYYDHLKSTKTFAIFIGHIDLNFSKDVLSRLYSLEYFFIKELSQDHFLSFLLIRLNRIGIHLDDELLNYSLIRLPVSYFWIDSFVSFVSDCNTINLKILKSFFDTI